MITVTYYYSACVALKTKDISILCDPWFTEGAFDGAWYHYPPIDDPLELVGEHNAIYISHIHPDHYDVEFLKQYLAKHPNTIIYIGNFGVNYLQRKMQADGIPHTVIDSLTIDETTLAIIPHGHIDSALTVATQGDCVVNMNDCIYSQRHIDQIKANNAKIDILLLTHAGAGPYPQTFYPIGDKLLQRAEDKKQEFFQRYRKMREAFNPRCCLPFAGQYILGGKLASLNPYRGVSDPIEVCEFDPSAVVLETGAYIDSSTLVPSSVRSTPYDAHDIQYYAMSLKNRKLAYETEFENVDTNKVKWLRLLKAAYSSACDHHNIESKWHIAIHLPRGAFVFAVNTVKPHCEIISGDQLEQFEHRIEITIDHRYLFGLLTGYYHWNNAEIGSLYTTRRTPDELYRPAQHFLHFFCI